MTELTMSVREVYRLQGAGSSLLKVILAHFQHRCTGISFPQSTPTMNFFERVYAIVRNVPHGQTISYGQVAFLAGNPHMARQVGWALHVCPDDVPWHRVVRKDGSLPTFSPDGADRQRELLAQEGIVFDENDRVLRAYFGDGLENKAD